MTRRRDQGSGIGDQGSGGIGELRPFVGGVIALACATLLAGTVLSARQAPRAPQPATPAAAAGIADIGKATFGRLNCSTCHGTDGGGTAAGPRIAGTALQLPAFTAYVRKPTGQMPAQATTVVSDQDLIAIHAYLQSPAARQAQAAPAPPAGSVEAGAALYKKNGCYQCHVDNAQGGPQGPRLGPNPIPMARFVTYVRNPTGDMPPFTSKVITDQDLASIYAFLQARPVPAPLASIPLLAP